MELLRITRQIHCKAVEQRATLIHRQYNRDLGTSYSRPPIDPYLTSPLLQNPGGTTGDTFRIVIHLSSTEYDNFSLSLIPVSTKVLQWYQTPQSTPSATPPSSARRLLGDYRGVEWNRCLRRSGEFLRYWITGKPLSWQFSIINPQLWRISLLYVRAESIIKLRQWSCLNPWMLSTKLAFDHCIAKHHSVRCSW